MKKFAVYIRVSTLKQGKSGLGLESQKKICEDYIKSQGGKVDATFKDVESGTHRNRKGLQDAIEYCKKNDCTLVFAKLDRLARDVEFCFKVVNTGIDIHFVDMPTINTLLLGVFAAVAQYERELTSDRTKKALQAKKARGEKLGGASIKWQESYKLKSKEEKEEWIMKKGELKRERHHDSKDIVAFTKVLRNVFPLATVDENPKKWSWMDINCKEANRIKILSMMRDYNDIDSSLFNKWDFDIGSQKVAQRLRSYMQSFQKSFTN